MGEDFFRTVARVRLRQIDQRIDVLCRMDLTQWRHSCEAANLADEAHQIVMAFPELLTACQTKP